MKLADGGLFFKILVGDVVTQVVQQSVRIANLDNERGLSMLKVALTRLGPIIEHRLHPCMTLLMYEEDGLAWRAAD